MKFGVSNSNETPDVALRTEAILGESQAGRLGRQLAGSISERGGVSHPVMVAANERLPRQPRWPALVIGFAATATLLWISALSWLLWRILFFIF